MWKDVHEKYKNQDMLWLLDWMENNTLVWCTDGSYQRKVASFCFWSRMDSMLHKI